MGQENELILVVADNGIGLPAENPAEMKIGIGLQSTAERLKRMYPDRHSLSIRKPAEGGAEVRIAIPLRLEDCEDLPSHEKQAAAADR